MRKEGGREGDIRRVLVLYRGVFSLMYFRFRQIKGKLIGDFLMIREHAVKISLCPCAIFLYQFKRIVR
jgi:hypothetical protein